MQVVGFDARDSARWVEFCGKAAVYVSDGDDVIAVIGDEGEKLPEVRAFADRWTSFSERAEGVAPSEG